MFEFEVSSNNAVLDLDIDKLSFGSIHEPICFHNDPTSPAGTIYLILPTKSPKEKVLHWRSTTSLTGPTAELIILTQNDVSFRDINFTNFSDLMVSDNKFYRDGNKRLTIKEDEHHNRSVTLENCKANNAYFLCNNLRWFGGEVEKSLYVKLHGSNTDLQIEGTDKDRTIIGSLTIPDGAKPKKVSIVKSSILHNFTCEGVKTLSIKDLSTGEGTCRLIADEIETLSNFQTLSDELIIKAEEASINSLIASRAKVQIEVKYFIEFVADSISQLKGMELHINVSSVLDKDFYIPHGIVEFDKIFIKGAIDKGAREVHFMGKLIVHEVFINGCNNVSFKHVRAEHITYETTKGTISFSDYSSNKTVIGSLWLIGSIQANFWGAAEVKHLETRKGRCSINIYNDFKANNVYLNPDLDQKKEIFDSENQEYFGIIIHNEGKNKVGIDVLLAKLTNLHIRGSVQLGKVICIPIDSKYNLIQIDAKYFENISIKEFFVGYDHDIVIDKTTGQISLVQSADRAITNSGEVFASVHGSVNHYMTIRAGKGLSFHGKLEQIEKDVELFTLYNTLFVSGTIESLGNIVLKAPEGKLNTNAVLAAKNVVTNTKTGIYVYDSKISALQFLSTTIGRWVMLESEITAPNIVILSENDELVSRKSNINASTLEATAKGSVRLEGTKVNATQISATGENVYVENTDLSGENSNLTAKQDISITESNVKVDNVTNQAGRDIGMFDSQVNTKNLVNEANGNISFRETNIVSTNGLHNKAGGNIEVESGSEVVARAVVNESGGDTTIKDSSVYGRNVMLDSKKGLNIDSSLILADHNIFLRALENFLSVSSSITLGQHPHKVFIYKEGVDKQGKPLIRYGFSLPSIEAIGIIGQKGLNNNFADSQFLLANSSKVDPGVLANENKKAIIIDADTGVIIGSSLSAKNHQIIIKTKHGIELLPLNLYNAAMFSGGFNTESVGALITKIEAGLIDLDGGSLIKSVGAYLRAAQGSLKADYIIDEQFKIEIVAKNRSLQELSIWLGDSQDIYDLVVNSSVVPTRLEFSEVTKIDLGKGKVNLFYPYQSKEVYLRQRQGDVVIDRDVHFPNQVMALHADQGKIFFGIPKTESFLFKFFGFSYLIENPTVEHVNVSGTNLEFSAGGGIELHGGIKATEKVTMQSDGSVKIEADKHNFGKEVKQSVVRADNAYITADNIEVKGSVITVKNNLKLVSHNDIKIIPIELINRYATWCGEKTFTKEMSIKQVVSEINAGIINIDAGRAVEFIGGLISAEGLNIRAEDLKIAAAKEIFTKQIEFKGKKKLLGGRNSWTDYTYTETVVPTEVHVGTLKMVVDQNATIEASQIFVRDQVLTEIGGNLIIKDGYNLHIHDYHAKKYSLLSFDKGGVKVSSSKSIKDFTKKTEGLPTLVCTGGIFYGQVDGRMHVLGSTIIGKDIHLVVPNGLKLEASKHTEESITFVSETGAKLGFYHKGQQEFGIRAGASASKEVQEIWRQHLSKTVIAAKDTLNILVRNGTFEQISSELAARIIHVEARNWVAKTYDEEVIVDHIKQYVESGAKIAIKQTVTSSIDKARMLINKKGTHVVDNLDRIFKAYDTYKSFAALPSNAATGGSYAYVEASQATELSNTSIAVDNIINGEIIVAKIAEDIRFQGVQMTAKDVDIEARIFTFETSKDKNETERDFGKVDIDIGISNPALSTGGISDNSSRSSSENHHQNYIRVSGNLKITLTSDGKFKGVSLEGANIDIKAKNLILESVQDVVAKKISGSNFHIGLDQKYGMQGFGGYAEKGSEKSGWTNQIARIVGTQVVNIVVKETLELAGGLIANSEEDKKGNLTDKGNLSVNCGRLIVKTIHDYDKGLTLGIGTSFQVSQNQERENEVSFHHAPLKVQFKDHKRTVAGTIGQGAINAGSIIGDPLNRDITKQVQETKKESAGFDAPIHADMLSTLTGSNAQKRSQEQQETLPTMLGNYFLDVADNFKGAMKDSIIAGAKAVNSVGGKIDTVQMDQRIEELFDWKYGAKLSPTELAQKKEADIHELAKTVTKVSIEDSLDLSDEKQYQDAINKAKYSIFFKSLGDELLRSSDNAILANKLSATFKIYQTYYAQELESAKAEGRSPKEFGDFIKELNRNNIYKNTSRDFVEKIHPAVSRALGEVERVVATAPDKDGTINNVMLHALAAAAKEVKQGKAGTGVAPDRVPDKPTSKDPNQTVKPEPMLTKETEEHLISVLGTGKSVASTVPAAGTSSTTAPSSANKAPVFGIPTAYAGSGTIAITGGEAIFTLPLTELAATAGAAAVRALSPLALPVTVYSTALSLNSKNSEALKQYITTANNAVVKNPGIEDLPLSASSVTKASSLLLGLDWANPQDRVVLHRVALGAKLLESQAANSTPKNEAVKPTNNPSQSTTPQSPPIDFKVMGSVEAQKQRQDPNSLAYTAIDPNANKPKTFSTPDQRDEIAKRGNLPGFTPTPLKGPDILSTPDQSDKIRELTKLPGFTPAPPLTAEDLILYKKIDLDPKNPTERKLLENLDTPAAEFIAKHRQAKILREFPGEYLDVPIKEVLEAAQRKDNKSAITAGKLIKDGRFSK